MKKLRYCHLVYMDENFGNRSAFGEVILGRKQRLLEDWRRIGSYALPWASVSVNVI